MEADFLTSCDEKGVIKTVSAMPPAHYKVELQGFSMLSKNNKIERYESAVFEPAEEAHHWKLILYPNGNKSKNATDNISVYVKLEVSDLFHSDVIAIFRIFLFNQINDNYYILQVANGIRFDNKNLERGFDQFMSLKKFNDPSNGYLVDDTCVFGAEVYVCQKNCFSDNYGEQLVMMNNINSHKFTWKIESFSTIATKVSQYSMSFDCGGHKWRISLYPKGIGKGRDSYMSVFLALVDAANLPIASQICTEYTMRIIDQFLGENRSYEATDWFNKSNTSIGWDKFILLTDFNEARKGFLVKDTSIIEVEVTVHGVTTALRT